jgi:hypothetical protein
MPMLTVDYKHALIKINLENLKTFGRDGNHHDIGDFDFNCEQRPLASVFFSYFFLKRMSGNFVLQESVLMPLGPFWIRIQIH